MKKKIALSTILAVLLCIGVVSGVMFAKSKNDIVQVEEGNIVKGKKIWTAFYDTTKAGDQASIKMIKKSDGKVYNCTLTYDGNYYRYQDENADYKYKYLLDLWGKLPGADYMTHWVVMADKEYTFDELGNSIISNNLNDSIDFEFVY